MPQEAGLWTRSAGHPDTAVQIHPSAATASRPAFSTIRSPGGWYDAGDYNKYVVNSGISTYTLLALYEHAAPFMSALTTQIPESGNTLPDVLDEALWNLRWMMSMQDPEDGGVYHKLTNAAVRRLGDARVRDDSPVRRAEIDRCRAGSRRSHGTGGQDLPGV